MRDEGKMLMAGNWREGLHVRIVVTHFELTYTEIMLRTE